MIITGPRLRLRPCEIDDFQLWARCYKDWPPDDLGYFTGMRCIRECDVASMRNLRVTVPLDDSSDWQQTLIIYTDDEPAGIGIHSARAVGTVLEVINQVLAQDARGRGYMNELQIMLQRYAFEILGASECRFALMDAAVSAQAHVANRAKYRQHGQRAGRAGPLTEGGILRSDWQAWVDARPDEKGSTWSYQA